MKNELANNRTKLHMDVKSIDLNKDYISSSLKNVDWDSKLAVTSTELLLDSVNEVLNYYCPLKKVSNSQKKNQSKPWITQGIIQSIAVRNRLHRKMCRVKDIMRKIELEKKVKNFKNNLVKLTRTSKANHYNNFFKENKLNLSKTWNGIRELINIRPKATSVTFLQV